MCISKAFTGGNIRLLKREENTFYLDNERRTSSEDWFYWAFSFSGKKGETYKFIFPDNRIGYFGPAVSHNLEKWEWLGYSDDNSFSYTVGEHENIIYFAHSMLYHPERFSRFAKENNLAVKELCKSKKGRSVPYISFGDGEKTILLTARHHACESTGSYVLEGVIHRLLSSPLENSKVIVIPFVDFDGVTDGDQGKGRIPYDHNRDYDINAPSLYPETATIKKLVENGVIYAFDFHSPWHKGGENDNIFVVQKRKERVPLYKKFGLFLESSLTDKALKYSSSDDHAPGVSWNSESSPTFAAYMTDFAKARLSFSLETAYFGKESNSFSAEKAIEFGRCFADALKKFDTCYK